MSSNANRLILALGANLSGNWGAPSETIRRTRRELAQAGLDIVRSSRIYASRPLGPGRQPAYLNAVLLLEARLAPAALLRLLKGIERRAGRRFGRRWGPRCLDIDILDYGARRLGCPARQRDRLVLPHPELARRAFVLMPLLEVAPAWRHPILGLSPRVLLARLDPRSRRSVRHVLDFAATACEKPAQ